MKIGLIISSLLHATALGWGLFWLSAPKSFEVTEIEALPVDIIPVSSITQVQEGDETAAAAEIAAPDPTTRQEPVEDAVNTGDNTVDLTTARDADPRPTEIEAAQAARQSEQAVPEPLPQEVPLPTARPEPAPATEVAALPEPQQAVQPDPVAEAIADAAEAEPSVTPFPASVPTPTARPSPAQTAKTPERKNNDAPSEPTSRASAKDSEFDSTEVAALLNRQDPAGGGARRSDREAALGSRTSNRGQQLSQSEMDALRGQIQRCWQIVPGMADGADVRVQVTMRLNRSGEIDGQPTVQASGGSAQTRRVLAGGARRAVLRCAPYNLPAEKYETWADVVVNFDPSRMF